VWQCASRGANRAALTARDYNEVVPIGINLWAWSKVLV
jgi:hypothetical protein